jgi:16S rRNA (cytidine1402-2'-O)-methyltransferase
MEKNATMINGILYVVATPIGNLADISSRAISTLNHVDVILAEDTRHSLPLLRTLGIKKPCLSLHAHNELDKNDQFITMLKDGKKLALISDAGTPLISDPGFLLVKHAQEFGIQVIPIPGPCALITALSAAGVACDRFMFAGFLPAKQQARLNMLQSFHSYDCTVIVYESTHRIIACLDDVITTYTSHYRIVLAKEITKTYEHFMHATAIDIKEWLLSQPARLKGEFVLIFPIEPKLIDKKSEEHLLNVLLDELPLKQAVKLATLLTDIPRNDLYQLALNLRK